jgi:hypothetical protein
MPLLYDRFPDPWKRRPPACSLKRSTQQRLRSIYTSLAHGNAPGKWDGAPDATTYMAPGLPARLIT